MMFTISNAHFTEPMRSNELTRVLYTFRKEFFAVGLFSMVANVLMLSPTLYMLQIYDRVIVSGSELTLVAVSLVTLFLFTVIAFAEWVRSRLLVRAGMRLDSQLSTRVFKASFEAYLSQTGNSPSRAFSDLVHVRQFFTGSGIVTLFDAPWAPIYMAVLFFLNPWLGFLALFFAGVQASLGWFGHRHTFGPSEAATQSSAEVNAFLQNKLHNAEVLESMGMVGNLKLHWHTRHADFVTQASTAQRLAHKITAWSKWIRYSQQSLALGAGAMLVIDGQLSPGGMIAANVLMVRALAPIDQIISTWRSFTAVKAAFARLDGLLTRHPERIVATHTAVPLGELTLQRVSASAPGRSTPILDGVDTLFPTGSVTAILGPSGSGKSTLARVIVGIWPEVQGQVLLDGLPLSDWSRADLGPHLGYLPQDVELFDGTIAENISRFTTQDSTKIIEAARCTGLHDMILRFPKGYDTPIGAAGSLLSGGQRQRIGLARAVYGDPCLIVLDEPNANLDEAGDAALLQAVATLKAKGKTVVLITHRPGALAVADRLLVLRDGKVQIQGPRDVVLAAMQKPQAANPTPSATAPACSGPGN